jgi:hypothetical protein
MHYLTQDFSWNADDGHYDLVLHSEVLLQQLIGPLMQSARYEKDGDKVMVAIFCIPQISMILHCKCKQGSPTGSLDIIIKEARRIDLIWPGVSRIFVRVRIMESTTTETMLNMLRDPILTTIASWFSCASGGFVF